MYNENLTSKEAFSRAAQICSKAEKCSTEIKRKIIEWGFDKYDAEAIVEQLRNEKFIDDERYARAFVREKFKFNKWGRIKISYSLKQKGMPEKYILLGLEEINEDQYVELLLKTMKDKAKTIKSNNKFDKMGKIIRFTQNRGFEPEYIHRYLDKILK